MMLILFLTQFFNQKEFLGLDFWLLVLETIIFYICMVLELAF